MEMDSVIKEVPPLGPPCELQSPLGFGLGDDDCLNSSLSTIFSTRIEEDPQSFGDRDGFATPHPRQVKPRRAHPFPFTSPSYLINVQKTLNGNKSSSPPPPPQDNVTRKRRKRTRSNKKKR